MKQQATKVLTVLACIRGKKQLRADYEESASLAVIALGGDSTEANGAASVRFKKPGACHKARWMAHVIYGIKMFLFRHQQLELGIIS